MRATYVQLNVLFPQLSFEELAWECLPGCGEWSDAWLARATYDGPPSIWSIVWDGTVT